MRDTKLMCDVWLCGAQFLMMYREKERTRARELSLAKDTLRLTGEGFPVDNGTILTRDTRRRLPESLLGDDDGFRSQHCCFQTNRESAASERARMLMFMRERDSLRIIKKNILLGWRERTQGVENCGLLREKHR